MDERVPKKESKTSLNATKNAAQTAAAERTSVLIPPPQRKISVIRNKNIIEFLIEIPILNFFVRHPTCSIWINEIGILVVFNN